MTTFVSTSSATWPERLIHEFDAADTTATELITGLNREQLNHHPSPAAWSIGQCLEHLCIFNEVYLPPIASALQGRHGSAVQEISPGWFERWFINNFVEPSPRTKPVPAPRKVVPHQEVELSVLDRFLRSNETARGIVRRACHYDVNRIRFRNPFVPVIYFRVGSGLEIVSKHERRHLLQAERVKCSLT